MKLSKTALSIILSASLISSMPVFAASAVKDTVITGAVKAKFVQDQSISRDNIKVSTKNGIVYLSGVARTQADASAAIQLAESVSGVKDVNASHLKVANSKQPMTDTAITAKVKGLFIREKLFGDQDVAVMSINVKTNNGIVALTGSADNQEQADTAIRLAKSVKGVRRVESRVTIEDQS
jgi:hyperosmotically inducible periplasmic protein